MQEVVLRVPRSVRSSGAIRVKGEFAAIRASVKKATATAMLEFYDLDLGKTIDIRAAVIQAVEEVK